MALLVYRLIDSIRTLALNIGHSNNIQNVYEVKRMLGTSRKFQFLRYFAIASLIACSATTFLLWNFYRAKSFKQLLNAGEQQHTSLATVISNGIWSEYGTFLKSSTSLSKKALLNQVETIELYEYIWKATQGTPITKIKIFDPSGRVIISTDASQIGKRGKKSASFLKAYAGTSVTTIYHIDHVDDIHEIDHNHALDALMQKTVHPNLLSSYLPIRNGQKNAEIEGVIEIYSDVTPLVHQIELAQGDILSALVFTFGLLYIVLIVIVYNGNRILELQMAARQLAEDELEQKIQQLAQSNAELEQFAYVASHDLQEPLRKIEAFGDRLQSKYGNELGDKGKEYIDRMQNAAGRMRILIQDLLEFSRVSGKAQPFNTVNLLDVVQGVLSDLETRIEETGSSIEVGTLPTLDADALQMRQLFQNLLGNALKFRREEEPLKVAIHSQISQIFRKNGQPKSMETCQITIADNGIGFEQKYTDRIFKVFQRLHSKSEYAGTGIGLAVCSKIVERHGGSITAESAPGQGATFIVTLPIQQHESGNRACKLTENPSLS